MFGNTQKRSHESPMDWEWQTQGPTDPNSPFPQSKQSGLKRGFEPQPQSSFINASSTPATPFRNPSFTTPRKPFDQDIFSEVSGAESSPADNADAEDTPEPKFSSAMAAFTGGNSEKKPIFGRYGAGFAGHSPGRTEQRRGKIGNAIVNKVRKRKRVDRDHAALIGMRGLDSDSEDEPRSKSRAGLGKSKGWFSQLLHDIESHPNLPNVLSFYAQLTLNFFFVGLSIFGAWSFWSTIKGDVDKASEEAVAVVVAEMAKCARDYVENGCQKGSRAPALEAVCDNWEHCMNRDPNLVGRAKISAHTFAQIFNSFIEPISYKAMIFVVSIVTSCILTNNLAFGMFRSKGHHPQTAPPFYASHPTTNFQWGPAPQTPHHSQAYDLYSGSTFQQIMPSQTPRATSPGRRSRSPSKENRRSPSKGDRY